MLSEMLSHAAVRCDTPDKASDSSTVIDTNILVLNDSETFGIFDSLGDIENRGCRVEGIFHQGTRFVSAWKLLLFGQRPLLLSSSIREDNDLLSADLTTPPLETQQGPILKGTVHVWRCKYIRNGFCQETLTLTNHSQQALVVPLTIQIDGDFLDVFELRGFKRFSERPQVVNSITATGQLQLSYTGLDKIQRRLVTELHCDDIKFQNNGNAEVLVKLPPAGSSKIELSLIFEGGEAGTQEQQMKPRYYQQQARREAELKNIISDVSSDNEHFNHWLRRSQTDMLSLLGRCGNSWYPFAGVPWYNTVFGRDGLFTAMQMLLVAPEIAHNVLDYLAKHQALQDLPELDAEPGKILHEERHGELAAIGEVPFQRYYGTVDATPVFVWLAGLYLRRTGDLVFIRSILAAVQNALQWLEKKTKEDDKGFVRYQKRGINGLENQGWKDSFDGINNQEGEILHGPIALIEAQGYAYQAWLNAAYLYQCLGEKKQSENYMQQAQALKKRFSQYFWDNNWGFCHLALDGHHQPAKVLSSNVGHCLACGIVTPQQAVCIAERLFGSDLFSGWGIRTLGRNERRYNPMSYHNGSVWPHDNAFIAMGLHQYGLKDKLVHLATALFEASLFFPLQRLPELYCGFERRTGEGPTHYPVACSPQAWATGVPYQLLQALLGIEINCTERIVSVINPILPPYLNELEFHALPLANNESIDLTFVRYRNNVALEMETQPRDWRIEVKYLN